MPEIPSGGRYDPKRETDARREIQRELEKQQAQIDEVREENSKPIATGDEVQQYLRLQCGL